VPVLVFSSNGRWLTRKPRLLLLDCPTEAIQPSIVVDVEELSLACGSVA